MEKLQRNAGTAGIVAAVLLALGFILFLSTGLDPQTASDPAKALPQIEKLGSRWAITGIAFVLATGFAALFLAGLFSRLREKAPTRAAATLYFGLIGLTGHALQGMTQWLGGNQLAAYAAQDKVAASHAWVALNAASQGLNGLGNAFAGASLMIAGWAVIATGVFPSVLGWVAVVAGVLAVLGIFSPTSAFLFFASIILIVVWLAWAGNELRRAR